MASKFSGKGRAKPATSTPVNGAKAPAPTSNETNAWHVLKAMPEFVYGYKHDPRLARLNHGIPEERLLAKLRLTDPKLTMGRLRELLAALQRDRRIEYGLFPTPWGSEKGWRKCS